MTDPVDNARYVLVTTTDTRAVDAALETLQRRHRIACAAFRRLVE